MKLRVGMPLVTRNAQRYTNAVVYKLIEGEHRTVVYVLSDFGNIMQYHSEEDVLENYCVEESYFEYLAEINGGLIAQECVDQIYDVGDRIEWQIELLTKALGELYK